MKSPKEITVEQWLMRLTQELVDITPEVDDLPLHVISDLINDTEIQAVQDFANKVSITRLGFNDHGPVHMRTVCHNALRMLKLLYNVGIPTSLQREQVGSFDDSVTAVALASFCHDFGMTIGRQDHELYSGILAYNIIDRILQKNLPDERDLMRRVVIRSTAMEGILGHMGTRKIHSTSSGKACIASFNIFASSLSFACPSTPITADSLAKKTSDGITNLSPEITKFLLSATTFENSSKNVERTLNNSAVFPANARLSFFPNSTICTFCQAIYLFVDSKTSFNFCISSVKCDTVDLRFSSLFLRAFILSSRFIISPSNCNISWLSSDTLSFNCSFFISFFFPSISLISRVFDNSSISDCVALASSFT